MDVIYFSINGSLVVVHKLQLYLPTPGIPSRPGIREVRNVGLYADSLVVLPVQDPDDEGDTLQKPQNQSKSKGKMKTAPKVVKFWRRLQTVRALPWQAAHWSFHWGNVVHCGCYTSLWCVVRIVLLWLMGCLGSSTDLLHCNLLWWCIYPRLGVTQLRRLM